MRTLAEQGLASVLVLAVAAVAVSSCAGDDATVRVLGAASLAEVLAHMEEGVEGAGRDVRLSVAGSATLVAQVEGGARADVVATADEESMHRLRRAGLVLDPVVLATNHLVIVVPTGNPDAIKGLADLAAPGMEVALGDTAVPVGRYARQAFARAGMTPPPATLEPSVTAIVTKVSLGEVDAGVVYATDVVGGEEVEPVAIPDEHQPAVRHYLAAGPDGGRGALEVVAWLTGPEGRAALRRLGFGLPERSS